MTVLTRAGAHRQAAQGAASAASASEPTTTTSFDAVPNDVLVSIFDRLLDEPEIVSDRPEEDLRRRSPNHVWVRETFPCVCKRWRDLYRSRQASPLHATLEVDLSAWARPEDEPESEGEPELRSRRRWASDVEWTSDSEQEEGDWGSEEEEEEEDDEEEEEEDEDDEGKGKGKGKGEGEKPRLPPPPPPPPPSARAARVIAWCRARARAGGDVRTLRVLGRPPCSRGRLEFTARDVAALVEILSPGLEEVEVVGRIGLRHVSLAGAPFWRAVETAVLPAGRLRRLEVSDVRAPLTRDKFAFFSQLTSLVELRLRCYERRRFPTAVLLLTNLRRLAVNGDITSLPRGISSLQRLEYLSAYGCSLHKLSEDVGALTRLTRLDLEHNTELGRWHNVVAFPESMRQLTRLRHVDLFHCGFSSVPSFICELKELEFLNMGECQGLRRVRHAAIFCGLPAPFPTPTSTLARLERLYLHYCHLSKVPASFLSSMPRLRFLDLSNNELSELPEGLGRCLPELREISLRDNFFETAPLRALAGARNLEKVDFSHRGDERVVESVEFLRGDFPRLRELKVRKEMWERDPTMMAAAAVVEGGGGGESSDSSSSGSDSSDSDSD